MSFHPFGPRNHIEYLAAAVMQGEGYLVRNGIPLRIADSGKDVTDIDTFGIKFARPFQPHRIICDCKDKQRSKPHERIFWTRGLADFIKANEAYAILPRASWHIVNFAKRGQVRVLTHDVMLDSFDRIYGKVSHPYGLANGAFYEPFHKRLLQDYKANPEADELLFRARSLYLVDDPYVAVNIAIADLSAVSEVISTLVKTTGARFEIWRYIQCELVVVIALQLVLIASDTLGLSKPERENHIMARLTYGDVSPTKAHEIFGLAKDLAYEAVLSRVPVELRSTVRPYDITIEPPPYAYDVCGLVDRAIQSPDLYHELPQLLDLLLFEQVIPEKGIGEEDISQTTQVTRTNISVERLKVARNVLTFVRDSCNVSLPLLSGKEKVEAGAIDNDHPTQEALFGT